jgi:hypothetical protein
MSDYKVADTELTSVANAIRAKTGKSTQIEFPTEFVSEIGSISGGGDDWPTRFYIIDPNVMDTVYNAQTNYPYKLYSPFDIVLYTDSSVASGGYDRVYHLYNKTHSNVTEKVISRNGFNMVSGRCLSKIKAGVYSKLYATVSVSSGYASNYMQAHIILCTNPVGTRPNEFNGTLKDISLVNNNMTDNAINTQPGVIISSSNKTLERQTVEIDISNVTSDFYVCIWDCDRTVNYRSLYLE